MDAKYSEIIIPDLGLYSHYPKEAVPRVQKEDGLHIGWSYSRNVSLSRKAGCIKKTRGVADFTASATGATDSVRGIGVYNKYARPNNYRLSQIKGTAANADDGHDDGTTYTNNTTTIRIGLVVADYYDAIIRFPSFTAIDEDTHIISAILKVRIQSGTGGNIRIYGDKQQNPSQISDHADYAGRTNTTAYVDRNGSEWVAHWNNIDITNIIQELVDAYDANTVFQIFLTENGATSTNGNTINAYDAGYISELEIITDVSIPSQPTYFMFVKGATAGELWKLNTSKVPTEVSQAATSYASAYQSQTAKFLQFGNDLLVTDDGYEFPQQWDISDNPSAFEDVHTTLKARYIAEFKSRLWHLWSNVSATIYLQRAYYSTEADQTTVSLYITLPGSDQPTAVIPLTQDDLIIFKEGSTIRVVDRMTAASYFQPFLVSSRDGSLGANVVSDGARIYGRNEKGVFQWPVSGHPAGFRYISKPIQNEIDKVTLDKMNLVWFCIDPVNKDVIMNYPDTDGDANTLSIRCNWEKDVWHDLSDFVYGNVMINAFDTDGTPIILFGQEDGHLKYITGDDNEDANFTGRIDTGALYKRGQKGELELRTLVGIEPISNYEGSYTLNFYYKSYDRPGDESGTSWSSAFTHGSGIGNHEIIPIDPASAAHFHIIRWDGTLKDEAFEIQA